MQETIAGLPLDRFIRVCLRGKRFAEQVQEQPESVGIKRTEVGETFGLAVGQSRAGLLKFPVFLSKLRRQLLAFTVAIPDPRQRSARRKLSIFTQPRMNADRGRVGPARAGRQIRHVLTGQEVPRWIERKGRPSQPVRLSFVLTIREPTGEGAKISRAVAAAAAALVYCGNNGE